MRAAAFGPPHPPTHLFFSPLLPGFLPPVVYSTPPCMHMTILSFLAGVRARAGSRHRAGAQGGVAWEQFSCRLARWTWKPRALVSFSIT